MSCSINGKNHLISRYVSFLYSFFYRSTMHEFSCCCCFSVIFFGTCLFLVLSVVDIFHQLDKQDLWICSTIFLGCLRLSQIDRLCVCVCKKERKESYKSLEMSILSSSSFFSVNTCTNILFFPIINCFILNNSDEEQ